MAEPELPSELEEEEIPQTNPKLALLIIAVLVVAAVTIYAAHQRRAGVPLAYPPGLTLRDERGAQPQSQPPASAAPPTSAAPSAR